MIQLNEKIWQESPTTLKFIESIDPKNGKKSFKIKGLLLPKGVISRNKVLYNWESIEQKHKDLIGRPLQFNHNVDGSDAIPKGHVVDSWVEDDGWYYEALVNPQWREIISAIEHGDLKHVSIQLMGDAVQEMFDENGKPYTEAYVGDIIELSLVPCPGFLQTNIQAIMSEKFGNKNNNIVMREDVTTSDIDTAIELLPKKDDEEACGSKKISELAQELLNKLQNFKEADFN